MHDLEYYKKLKYTTTIIPLANGKYRITYVNLPGVMGEGDTIIEAEKNAEANRLKYTKTMLEKGLPVAGPQVVTKLT